MSDLFFHLTHDFPLAFADCGHFSKDAHQLIEMTKKYWQAFANFRSILHAIFEGHLDEIVNLAQGAGMAIIADDWYGAGKQVGLFLDLL